MKEGNLVRVALLVPQEVLDAVARLMKKNAGTYGFKNRNRALNSLIESGLLAHGGKEVKKRRS